MTTDFDPLGRALHAAGPFEPQAGRLDLFGRFVGAWDLEWRGTDRDGRERVVRGDLHFGWILGGRLRCCAVRRITGWRHAPRSPLLAL